MAPGLGQNSKEFTSLSLPAGTVTTNSFNSSERHLQGAPTGLLYSNSGFAHGFRHGYERGYHLGDLDFQMGRNARVPGKFKAYQQSGHEYSPGYGSRQLFEDGYNAGFTRGYADAISGLEFRALDQARSSAAGLSEVLPPTRRHYFDEGFAGGFRSSQLQNAPVEGMSLDYLQQYCRTTTSGPYALEYCSGFSRGYMLGTSAPRNLAKIAASESRAH
jgi:hypothetical protein